MNKFLSAILVTGTALAMYSCNNGAYDAKLDNNTGVNPLNPNSGTTLPVGHMRATINKVTYPFYPAYYKVGEDNSMGFFGAVPTDEPALPDEKIFQRKITMGFSENKVDPDNFTFTYSYIDTLLDTVVVYAVMPNSENKPSIKLKPVGNEGGNYFGKFSGTVYRWLPKRDMNDSLSFTDGEYHLPKNTKK